MGKTAYFKSLDEDCLPDEDDVSLIIGDFGVACMNAYTVTSEQAKRKIEACFKSTNIVQCKYHFKTPSKNSIDSNGINEKEDELERLERVRLLDKVKCNLLNNIINKLFQLEDSKIALHSQANAELLEKDVPKEIDPG